MTGLTSTGFERKTADVILSEIIEDIQDEIGSEFALNSDTFEGVLVGVTTEKLSELWELIEAVYYNLSPDTAEGVNQDYTNSLVNVGRIGSASSTCQDVTLTNNTASPATIPAGSLARQSSTLKEWRTITEVIIPANDTITVDMECTEVGANLASAGSIDTVVTTILGWDEVNNTNIATAGRLKETDSEYRLRRMTALSQSRGSVSSAIANIILTEVTGVLFTTWRENREETTDINGLPPHSVEIIVEGGDDLEIAEKILEVGGGGIETFGTESESVTDSEGNTYTIRFSRVTSKQIYLIINLTTDGDYPVDGDNQVKELVATYINSLDRGEDVKNWKIDSAFKDVPGITGVTSILQGFTDPPTLSANLTIANSERAFISETEIVVNN